MKRTLQLALVLVLGASMVLRAGSGLIKAATNGDLVTIHDKLKDGEKVNEVDSNGWTALMWAVYYRQLPAMELLLENGADPNLQSTGSKKSYPKGATALIITANDCQENLANPLIKHGAKKELADSTGATAESYARKGECLAVLQLLGVKSAGTAAMDQLLKEIEGGKDVNAADENGWTPVMWSVYYQDLPTTELLLQKGANPNARATGKFKEFAAGATPLIVASFYGLDEMVGAVLKAGGDPKIADAKGETPAVYARKGRFNSVLVLLGAAIDPWVEELIEEIKAGKKAVDARDEFGWTPLMQAVSREDLQGVKLLLDMGADPNVQSNKATNPKNPNMSVKSGTTALILASQKGNGEIIKLLLNRKANAVLKDESSFDAERYALISDAWDVQDALLTRAPIKKTYNKLVINEFVGHELSKSDATNLNECKQKLLSELKRSRLFESVELMDKGARYDDATLFMGVDFTDLKLTSLALRGAPRAKLSIKLYNALDKSVERDQAMSLTTGLWRNMVGAGLFMFNDFEERNSKFLSHVGSIISDYVCLATGKATPSMEGLVEYAAGPSVRIGWENGMVRLSDISASAWQVLEQVPIRARSHAEGFDLSDLKGEKIAFWPISHSNIGENVTQVINEAYGNFEKYTDALSIQCAERCIKLANRESLDSMSVDRALVKGEAKEWLDCRRILPWANSSLLAKNKLAKDFGIVAKMPEFKDIHYAIVPYDLRTIRVVDANQFVGGPFVPVLSTTKTSLCLAVIDVPKQRVVWMGDFTASASSSFAAIKALHENEDEVIQKMEKELRQKK